MDWEEKKTLKEYQKWLKKELFEDLSEDVRACAHDYHKHKMLASVINTIYTIDKLTEEDDHERYESKGTYGQLTPEMVAAWAAGMINTDGTKGAHWTIEQTTSVAEQNGVMFDHITPEEFYIAMNAMYSDYGKTLMKAGVADVSVFAELAKDFLFDADAVSPSKKLCDYYKYIVKK